MCSRCCWDRRSTPTGVIPSHDASSRGCENRAKSPISAISPSAVNVEIPRNRVRIFHLPGPPLAAGDLAQPRVERGELALDPVQVGSAAATRPGPAGSRCGGCSRGSVSRAMSSRASLIPVRAGDRVKTDRRDAKKLVALYRAGLLRFVYPPTVERRGLRDLLRARDDVRCARMAARNRVLKQLLRHGRIFREGKTAWTKLHRAWLARQRLDDPLAQETLEQHRQARRAALLVDEPADRALGRLDPAR